MVVDNRLKSGLSGPRLLGGLYSHAHNESSVIFVYCCGYVVVMLWLCSVLDRSALRVM